MAVDVNDRDEFDLLSARFSAARLAHYLEDRATELDIWNTQVAGALLTDIGYVEVTLRNTLDQALAVRHESRGLPGTWLDDPVGGARARPTWFRTSRPAISRHR